jgi:hypothetical protein
MAYIDIPNHYLPGAISAAKTANTPVEHRFSTRPASTEPVDVAQISKEAVKPQPLALNAELPEIQESQAGVQQCGQNDEVCFFLASAAGLKDIALAAKALRQEKLAIG